MCIRDSHAISGTYPPGSTFKLVPAAAALQEAVVSPERFLFDPGTIEIPNRFAPNDPGRVQPFACWNLAGHGSMNMRLGIANSCDVYFYKISGGFDQDGEFVEGLTVDRIDVYGSQFGKLGQHLGRGVHDSSKLVGSRTGRPLQRLTGQVVGRDALGVQPVVGGNRCV